MMQMQSDVFNGGDHYNFRSPCSDRAAIRDAGSQASPRDRYSKASDVGGSGRGSGFIEHPVSKMDTLAGVAIKYGVEVADIKRINGLVTDLQMFALKSLQIPTPGRHPPSPCLSNGFDTPGSCLDRRQPRRHSDLFDSFQSLKETSPSMKVSPAMSSLQGYYGLQSANGKSAYGGCEMAIYRRESAQYLEDDFPKASPASGRPLSYHRKSRSVASGFFTENGELVDGTSGTESRETDFDRSIEKLYRRRQKSEANCTTRTSETLLKEENTGGGGFSAIAGKGLALRSKAASRTCLTAEMEAVRLSSVGLGDSFQVDGFAGVRKSSSTSSLQDQDSASSSSLWPTSKWSLKPDGLGAAIGRPMFDGLPKPITGRRKAALD